MSGKLAHRLGVVSARVAPFVPPPSPRDDPVRVRREWDAWGELTARLVEEGTRDRFREMWSKAGPSEVWADRSRRAALDVAAAVVGLETDLKRGVRLLLSRMISSALERGMDLSGATEGELDGFAARVEEAAGEFNEEPAKPSAPPRRRFRPKPVSRAVAVAEDAGDLGERAPGALSHAEAPRPAVVHAVGAPSAAQRPPLVEDERPALTGREWLSGRARPRRDSLAHLIETEYGE